MVHYGSPGRVRYKGADMIPIFMAAIGGVMFGYGIAHNGTAPALFAVIGARSMMAGTAILYSMVT